MRKNIQIVIVIEHLAPLINQQRSLPASVPESGNKKVLRRLRNWQGERASNSKRRDWGRKFQADGPTRAKHLEWAVAERMRGTTIRPLVEDRKEALAGKEETKVQKDLR